MARTVDPQFMWFDEFCDNDDLEISHAPSRWRQSGFIDKTQAATDDLNDLISSNISFAVQSWASSQRRWIFRFDKLSVELIHDVGQPLHVCASSDEMPRRYLDGLRAELKEILNQELCESSWSAIGFGVMLLQMTEEAEFWLEMWETAQLAASESAAVEQKMKKRDSKLDWDSSVHSWSNITSSLMTNVAGLNLMTTNHTAKFLLGQSIGDICAHFPDYLRVLHVEPVFRNDLVARFFIRQQEIHDDLLKLSYADLRKSIPVGNRKRFVNTHQGYADGLSQASVTFHGAPRNIISSIVRYGFLVPGQEIGHTGGKVQIARGASYGIGIYSSPDAKYASMYSDYNGLHKSGIVQPGDIPGFRLIVCATLMGRPILVTREKTRQKEGLLVNKGVHSHVAPNYLEYIVFDSAQIIPCYVLHIDYGSDPVREALGAFPRNKWEFKRAPNFDARKETEYASDERDCPGAVKSRREARKAAALKWFPYGYGPATGTQFVIEEVGEVSDDEEDYGEYQALRQEQGQKVQESKNRKPAKVGGSWFDEYQTVRNSNKEVRVNRE